MPSRLFAKLASLFKAPAKSRLYVNAAAFDPYQAADDGQAVVILACDEQETIYERVCAALQGAAGVVVLDQGSRDATPHLAAEAGAVVVLQGQGETQAEALEQAVRLARRFSKNVVVQ